MGHNYLSKEVKCDVSCLHCQKKEGHFVCLGYQRGWLEWNCPQIPTESGLKKKPGHQKEKWDSQDRGKLNEQAKGPGKSIILPERLSTQIFIKLWNEQQPTESIDSEETKTRLSQETWSSWYHLWSLYCHQVREMFTGETDNSQSAGRSGTDSGSKTLHHLKIIYPTGSSLYHKTNYT